MVATQEALNLAPGAGRECSPLPRIISNRLEMSAISSVSGLESLLQFSCVPYQHEEWVVLLSRSADQEWKLGRIELGSDCLGELLSTFGRGSVGLANSMSHALGVCKESDFVVHGCGTWETKIMMLPSGPWWQLS